MTDIKASAAALPAELVLETFRYLAIEDRVAARAVCRAWRALAAACPVVVTEELWFEPDQLRCLLDQMRGAPLLYDSCIDFDSVPQSKLASIIAAHMDRTVVIALEIICGYRVPPELRPPVTQPAPLLERLRLELSGRTSLEDFVLFGQCAPRLTHCSVYTCGDIIPALAPFKTIRVLVLLGVVLYSDVELIFREFPALDELSLCITELDEDEDYDDDLRPSPPPPLRPPTGLRHLTVTSEDGGPVLMPVFAWILHESVEVVSVRHYKDSDPWRDSGAPPPDMVQRMLDLLRLPANDSLVVSCAPKECALRLRGADGRTRVHAGIYRETLAELLKTTATPLAAAVTALVVAGVHVLYSPDLVPSLNHFKALRSFTLILRRLSPEKESFSVSLCIPPIYCPALESVTLGITRADYKRVETVSLTAKEVREFLRDKLREDLRGKLEKLYLWGVSVEDLSALEPCADEICMRSYEPLNDFVYPEDDLRRFDDDDFCSD